MIGAVIQARTHSKSFPGKVLHRFDGRSVLEIVILNALQAEQLHKVVVTMPMADRTTVHGSTLRPAALSTDLAFNHKKPLYYFDIRSEDVLSRLYWAAAENNLDHIVRIRGNTPLMPTWFINDVIYKYFSEGMNCFLHTQPLAYLSEERRAKMYNKGFALEIIPFWMLAKAHLYCEDRIEFSNYLAVNFSAYNLTNDRVIPEVDRNLAFESPDQAADFEELIREINLGVDIGELLEETSSE